MENLNNEITMQELIEKYSPIANCFEITIPFHSYNGVSFEHPYGNIRLSEENANIALNLIEEKIIDILQNNYNDLSKKVKNKLPDFFVLFNDIYDETKKHLERSQQGLLEEESPFLCDEIYENNTLYKEPVEFFWHMYHLIQFLFECQEIVLSLQTNLIEKPLDYELHTKENSVLSPHLISIITTFTWHCSISNELHKVFRFKLNDATKKWLLQFETDYDIKPFEDLAFYSDEKLLFSSCTHERYHYGFSNFSKSSVE